MRTLQRLSRVSLLCFMAAPITLLAAQGPHPDQSIPHLEKRGEVTELIVNGQPFLMLAGELRNNSATSLDYMKPIWPKLAADHLNTVLAGVSWAQFEPTEGKFDYALVDGLIRDARQHNLHLVFLWFGSWKNSWSSYAPDWVKRDFQRFPRVELRDGTGTERLSPFSSANWEADARAFAAFMRNIREVDAQTQTVLMIQVENEVGVIPDARDHSPAANAAYDGLVPQDLMHYLQKHLTTLEPELRAQWQAAGFRTAGTWKQVFGPGPKTEDLFMAWYYARYVEKVVEAGKAEYPIPMYVNAALVRPGYAPGQYNSGGPLAHSMDVWKAGAPRLDFLAPDIYFNFEDWVARYDRPGNPLFIPEAIGGPVGAAEAFYAIGGHHALGFSPFGIDSDRMLGASQAALQRAYEVLSQLSPLILKNQTKGAVTGVMLGNLTPSVRLRLGDYTLNISKEGGLRMPGVMRPLPFAPVPHGIFINTAPGEYFMAGSGLQITFSAQTPGPPIVGLATVQEGRFVDGKWVVSRTLAGDATGEGNNISLRSGPGTGILRVTLYRYR